MLEAEQLDLLTDVADSEAEQRSSFGRALRSPNSKIIPIKINLSFWQLWNISFGFFGIQVGWGLQMANASANF